MIEEDVNRCHRCADHKIGAGSSCLEAKFVMVDFLCHVIYSFIYLFKYTGKSEFYD